MAVVTGSTAASVLLRPVETPLAPGEPHYWELPDLSALPPPGTVMGADFETCGLDASHPDFRIILLGLSWNEGECWWITPKHPCWRELISRLADYRLLAHNVMFDGTAWVRLLRDLDLPYAWPWWACTYGAWRHLSDEGYPGQSHSLETAELVFLRWAASNKDAPAEWLVSKGFTRRKDGAVVADKAHLWRVPPPILGPYCAWDANACLQFWNRVLVPALERLTAPARAVWQTYHHVDFIGEVELLAEQLFYGNLVDVPKLADYYAQLQGRVSEARLAFLSHPQVSSAIEYWNDGVVADVVAAEPPHFTKTGKTASRWWKWKQKLAEAQSRNHFNMNSTQQLQWLFYEKLGFPVRRRTKDRQPSTDEKALLGFGDVGKVLTAYSEVVTLEGYVKKCLEFHREGELHLQLRAPGTLTHRLAGTGGLSIQQVPKDAGYLECWIPREGAVWVNSDVCALEQVVLAELSEDRAMMQLYGPGAKLNQDVYLFNGAHYPGIGEQIRKWYNPDKPPATAEELERAKKECKHARFLAKKCSLGFSYGMGPGKLQSEFAVEGITISEQQAVGIWEAHWELYKGVRSYGERLAAEWKRRGGWVYSGLGLPVPVAPQFEKDLVNRVVQKTGHDILMKLLTEIRKLRRDSGLVMYPVVVDWHDQTLWECAEEDGEEVAGLIDAAYTELNTNLGGIIPIKGDTSICRNMKEAKL